MPAVIVSISASKTVGPRMGAQGKRAELQVDGLIPSSDKSNPAVNETRPEGKKKNPLVFFPKPEGFVSITEGFGGKPLVVAGITEGFLKK